MMQILPAALTIELSIADEPAMNRLGQDLALALSQGDLVTLTGDLGAGKSTLARSIIRSIAGDADYEVPSPTFTLVQSYSELRLPIDHADLYRLSSAEELDELGLDEALENGAVLVEWPQQGEGVLPAASLAIIIEQEGEGRRVRLEATGEKAERLVRSLNIRKFLEEAGRIEAQRSYLLGDASPRGYELINSSFGTEILMNAPLMPSGPLLRDGKTYRQIAHLAETPDAFVAVAQILREKGFAVPEIYAQDLKNGFLLMQHLGTDGLLDENRTPIAERYAQAARLLAHIHSQEWPLQIDVEGSTPHLMHRFDRDAMMIEVELLTSWYMPYRTGSALSDAEQTEFVSAWDQVFSQLHDAEYSLLLRDYHSPNILWQSDKAGVEQISQIDFQDAMIGPSAYDLASLTMDARVTISQAMEQQLYAAYCDERHSLDANFDEVAFRSAYAIMAAQRNSKILGIFVRLSKRDGKDNYLPHLPRIRAYLRNALQHPVLAPVLGWFEKHKLLDDA